MSRSDFITHHIATEFGALACHIKGSRQADRAIIFLHGHVDTAMENGNYRIFDSDDDVIKILLDHRWHGSSTRTRFYPSISERSEDLNILLGELPKFLPSINKVDVIGYSQGGSVLLYFLLNDFEQKRKVDSAFLLAPRLDLKSYLKWFHKEREKMEIAGETQFAKRYKSKGYVVYNTKYLEEFATINYFEILDNLQTKTTLLRGDADDFLTAKEAHKLVNLNEEYLKYIEIKGLSHYPKPEQWHDIYDIVYASAKSDHGG